MKEDKGLRYNDGKTRYDLLPAFAVEQMARVFTKGAEKYRPRNWEAGMAWSKVLASMKRHIAAFEMGEDFDKETGLLHMAHAMTNAAFLIEYYKIYPMGDDRPVYQQAPPRIGLDVDEVLADFVGGIKALHPEMDVPEYWNDYTLHKHFEEVVHDDAFWAGLKPRIDPTSIPFEPACYITFRAASKDTTVKWLEEWGFPKAEVISLEKHGASKVQAAKDANIDIFVDDRYETFLELNAAGIFCYLMDAPHNRRYDVGFRRISSLSDIMSPTWAKSHVPLKYIAGVDPYDEPKLRYVAPVRFIDDDMRTLLGIQDEHRKPDSYAFPQLNKRPLLNKSKK